MISSQKSRHSRCLLVCLLTTFQNKNVGTRPRTSNPAPVVVVTPTPAPAPVVSTPKVEAPVVVVTPAPKPVETPKVEAPAPVPTSAPAAPVVVPQPSPSPAAPVVDNVVTTPVVGEAPKAGNYKDAVLYSHNVHRANHSAPALTFSDELASYAKTVADKCVWGHDL